MLLRLLKSRLAVRSLVLLSGLMFAERVVGDDSNKIVDSVVKAWNDRVKKVESFDFRWECERLDSRPLLHPEAAKNALENPPPGAWSKAKLRFLLDGHGRVRLEDDGRELSNKSVDFFDGKTRATFYPKN